MTENDIGTAIIRVGYLLNFKVADIRDGVVRWVNSLQPGECRLRTPAPRARESVA